MVEILERGDVSFFYRPAVQPAEGSVDKPGVQRFFMVLGPAGGRAHRRIRIGRKRMPAPSGERFWGLVERVGSLDRVLRDQLEDEHYHTKTRGERYQPGARPIARGCYAFVRHGDHCHFVYRVDETDLDPLDETPELVRVPEAASHVVLFERIPRARATWTTEGAPSRLDDEGAEIVLVGVDDDPEHELGIELLPAAAN